MRSLFWLILLLKLFSCATHSMLNATIDGKIYTNTIIQFDYFQHYFSIYVYFLTRVRLQLELFAFASQSLGRSVFCVLVACASGAAFIFDIIMIRTKRSI